MSSCGVFHYVVIYCLLLSVPILYVIETYRFVIKSKMQETWYTPAVSSTFPYGNAEMRPIGPEMCFRLDRRVSRIENTFRPAGNVFLGCTTCFRTEQLVNTTKKGDFFLGIFFID